MKLIVTNRHDAWDKTGFCRARWLSERVWCWLLVVYLMCSVYSYAGVPQKAPVRTADDLPRHTYDVKGPALELVKDKTAMLALAAKLQADIESDLQHYDITDRSTLLRDQSDLYQIDLLNERYDQALARIPAMKAVMEREADKMMTGLVTRAHVAGLKTAKASDGKIDQAAYAKAFMAELRSLVSALPMDVIRDRLQKDVGAANRIDQKIIEGAVTEILQPILDANAGKIPRESASALIGTRNSLDALTRTQLAAEVYSELLAKEISTSRIDVWTPTLVTLDKARVATPVVVAVWDCGFDPTLFPGQLWTNPNSAVDGKDAHGIAFNLDWFPTSGDLYPLENLKGDKTTYLKFLGASSDLQAGVQSPEVDAMIKYVKSLSPKELKEFQEDSSIVGNYTHGTHVAGIVAAGNPFVRLMNIRHTFDYKLIPDEAPSVELYQRGGAAAQTIVNYVKAAHAKVVNMSWYDSRELVEDDLAHKGVGKTTADRAELSRKIFGGYKAQLESAIASAPEILFVAAAGNDDNDANFSERVPSGLRLPNLLVVGAVDAYGKPTTFTTTGKDIDLYADGFEVDSVIPGGKHVKLSGTSMASPQVANLAAKLIALKPDLTVAQTIALIRKGATPLAGQKGKFIINPAASIKLLSTP